MSTPLYSLSSSPDMYKIGSLAASTAVVSYALTMWRPTLPLMPVMYSIGGGVGIAYMVGSYDSMTPLMVAAAGSGLVNAGLYGTQPIEGPLFMAASGAVAYWAGCKLSDYVKKSKTPTA